MPYSPTTWVNLQAPALNATNLNKLTNELEAQALEAGISHVLPNWSNGVPPALTDAAHLNEMERVLDEVATSLSLSYTPTIWSGGWIPARNATRLNKMEVQAQANRAALDSAPPGDAYFNENYADGLFNYPPWSSLFSYSGSGSYSVGSSGPTSQTADGRVAIVNDPAGGPGKAARFELRDADPAWPPLPDVQKSEARTITEYTFDQPGGINLGGIRWFRQKIYLPYNVTEKFEWAHGGSQPYTDICDLHNASGVSGFPAMQIGLGAWMVNAGDDDLWMNILIYGGPPYGTTYFEGIPLFRLTDASANRFMANYNRWIDVIWGMRFAPDNTGWLEVWVDGANIYPRTNRPTMWTGDYGMYFKYGVYVRLDASFPETGRTVIYRGLTTIGYDRPF